MDGQLIKATHLLTLPTNFLSVTSISLFTSNNFKGKSIPLNISKRNLNTLNLIKNGHCLQQKNSKLNFSFGAVANRNFESHGPKVQPIQNINSSILELTRLNNNFNPEIHKVVPFYLDTVNIGVIPENVFIQLKKYNKTFKRRLRPFSITSRRVTFSEYIDTYEKKSQVMEDLLIYWRDNDTFDCLKGWRNEVYPIFDANHEIAFRIERSGIALFGFRAYGCHINGYVEDSKTHQLKMWIAQRSFKKQTFPGKLDNIVAGGVSFPFNPTETAIKECLEEASIPNEISTQIVPCGAVTYISVEKRGISTDSQYVFDLKLPDSYQPKPLDNEVEGFYLMDFKEIIERLKNNEFKVNSGIVIIDFMIRHGILTHTMEENYLEILSNIHRPIPFPGPNFIKIINNK
jgi:isopentenyldiphosphate isomerase